MAQAFNLTAQLNLKGPNNVNKIVSQIKKQLGTINANVNVTVNPATIQTVTQLSAALTTLNTTLTTTSANATTTAAAINSLMQSMNAAANSNINQSLNNASNAVQQLGANANAAAGGGGGGGGVTQLRTEMEEFGRQSALAVRRFAAFSLVTSTVFALTNAFNQAFKAFIDFDKEFVKLQQVTGESASGLQKLAGTITELSTNLGVSSAQLTTVSSTLAQAGLSAKDTERALKALALSSLAPSFDDMNKTVEGSIALMRQFGISADQLGAALGSVNAVSAQFAVESSDIIAAIQRTGGVFASASKGVSEGTQALNEFIAVFTSVRATTRESAETIATGLRTIFTRIQRGSTIEALKEFGVTLTDAEGKFVGAYKAVELLSRGLNGIDPRDLKFSQIVEELGGFRQIGKVIPLIQQFGTAQQALAVAQGGQTSLTEDAIVAQLSLANQFAKVREEFVAMVREIGGTDTFQTLAKGALQLASALIQIADSVKGVLPVLAVMTAVRGVGAMRQFGRGFVGGMRGGQQNAATGGMIRKYAVGGQVPVALMPGETVVYPNMVNRIGVPKLRQLNHADKKMARGGGVGLVPGKGRTDSFKTTLPVGSFVIRTDATRALGGPGGVMQAARYAIGGDVQDIDKPNKASKNSRVRKYIKEQGLSYGHHAPSSDITAGGDIIGKGLTGVAMMIPDAPVNQASREGQKGANLTGEAYIQYLKKTPAKVLFAGQLGLSSRGSKYKIPKEGLDILKNPKVLKDLKRFIISSIDPKSIFNTNRDFDIVGKAMLQGAAKIDASGVLEKSLLTIQEIETPKPSTDKKGRTRNTNRQTMKAGNEEFQPSSAYNKASALGQVATGSVLGKSTYFGIGGLRRKAAGGLIQHFMAGSTKPLKALSSMGKSDLLREADKLGVFVPMDSRPLLDSRANGSEQARADLIQKLEAQRLIKKTKTEKTSEQAKRTKVAVIGSSGPRDVIGTSEEVTIPGVKNKAGQSRKLPATLEIGGYPEDSKPAKKIKAAIENAMARASLKVAKIAAKEAGIPIDQLDPKMLKQLARGSMDPSAFGSIFGAGMGIAANSERILGGADPAAMNVGSADIKKLPKQLAESLKVTPEIPADFTRGAEDLLSVARRKASGVSKKGSKKSPRSSQLGRALSDPEVLKNARRRAFGGQVQKLALGKTVYHGTGVEFDKPDVTKSLPGVIGSGIYAGLNQTGLAADYARKGMGRTGTGGIYPMEIKGGITDFVEATAPLSENPKALTSIEEILKKTKIPKSGIDLTTFSTALDSITEQLSKRIEPKLRKQKDIKDPGFEAIKIASQQARELMVTYGIPGAKKIANRGPSDRMVAIYDQDRIGKVGKPSRPKKRALGGIIQKFGRGGLSNRLGVFDFDMTTGKGAQQETPSLSGFKNPDLAVPDILGAKPTGVISLMKQYGASRLLTARSGGPKGEMTTALGSFFKKNGVYLPSNRIETLGDQVNNLSTAEKKARALHALVKRYGSIDFYDDNKDNVEAGKSVRGVNAHRVKLRKASGGEISSPMDNMYLSRSSKDKRLDPKKYARGGDVPIIAQSGEYVVNKKSAKSFGYNNLAKINKYHSGGVVGKVQKFASGGQPNPKLDNIAADSMGLNSRVFQIFEKTLFRVSDLFNGMGVETRKTTQALDMIAAVSPNLRDAIRANGIVNNRTATAQEAVAVHYASLASSVQKNAKTSNDLQTGLGSLLLAVSKDTNAKNQSATTTKGLGSKISSAWNKASGIVSQAASSFAATLGKKSSIPAATPSAPAAPPPQSSSLPTQFNPTTQLPPASVTTNNPSGPVSFTSPAIPSTTVPSANPWSTVGGGMGVAASGGGSIASQNQAQNQAQAIAQVQGMAQTQTQKPSMMGRIGQGVRGMMGGQGSMAMGFALPMLASSLSGGEAASAQQAENNAMIGSVATGAGIGASLLGLPGMLVGAVGGLITGIDAGAKAARQFTVNMERTKIEDSGEKLAKTFAEISKQSSATPAQLAELNAALKVSTDAALQAGEKSLPKAGLSQILTEIGTAALLGGETSKPGNIDTRAAIFEKQGFMGLIKAVTGGPEVEQQMFRDIAPMLGRETAKGYAVAASQAKSVFEQQFKQGKSIEDLMNGPEWNKQAEVLARSNAAIQEQILLIQNSTSLGAEEKKARISNLIASEAETQARKQFAEVKAAEDLKKLQKEINNVSFSFNRMLGNMDAAVQSSVANLAKLDESLSLSSASLSGGAKVGSSSGVQNTLDVLKNPGGYNETQKNTAFSRAASPFGSQAGNIEKVLKAGSGLESTVLGTINKTLAGSKGETQEAITAKIESALRSQFKDLQLPPALADKLSKKVGESVGKLRQDNEDTTIDYSQLTESIPELSKTIDLFKNTADQASKAIEFNKQAFDKLSDATNQQIDLTTESNARTRNAQNILAKGSMDLNKALGRNVSLGTRRSAIESPIRSMTGGTTDPSAIGMNYNKLEAQRQQLQTGRNQAAASNDVGAVRAFDNQLAQTNTSLRENIDALKGMADSSELASAALEEIDKAQKRQQAGVGIMEKLVTSTPKELANMNQAFARLDANMRGIAVGGTNPEQRKQSLEMFQMIAPFLGDQEKGLQANVLQSMLQESGVGISPMLQQVLDGMRNPMADPQQALAIQTYQEATQKQADANLQLATMNANLADDISTKTGNAVAEAIRNNTIKFEAKQLADLVSGVNNVPTAVGKADGGLIYKAVGGSIFKPKGTDTVPAMLTPGEFVVNRSATQANLPLLKSINNGYSKGGKVKYLASGGVVNNLFDDKDVPDDLATKGISKTPLPFISPEVIPIEDGDAKLVGLRASVFPTLPTDGIDPGFKKFVDAIKAKTKSVEDNGKEDPDRKGNFFKNIASLGINPQNYPVAESVKPVLGLTDSFMLQNDRETMLKAIVSRGDTNNAGILIPKVFPRNAVTANMDAETIASLPYNYENITKMLAAGGIPNPIGKAYLNDQPPNLMTLKNYGNKKSTDIANDSRLKESSANSQLFIIGAINRLLHDLNIERMLEDVKNKIIYKAPDTYTPPNENDFPKNVKDLYNRGLLYLNSDKDISGKFMMPAIGGKKKTIGLTRTNSLGATNNNLWGMGNNGYSAENSEIKEEFFNKFVTDIVGYKQSLKDAETELKQALTINGFFSGTSSKQQKYAGANEILQQIKSGGFPGLYLPIQNDLLSKNWKETIATNPLFIFRNSVRDWEDNIKKALEDDSFPEFKSIKGYGKAGEKKQVELDSRAYPWLAGSSGAVERFTQQYYGAEATKAKENYISPFDIGIEPIEYPFDTKIPLNSIKDGLGSGTLQAAFKYYPINKMPQLSSADGYARPAQGKEYKNAVLIRNGNSQSTDPKTIRNLLDPSKRADAPIFAQNPGEVEQEINRALTDYVNGTVGASIQNLKLATPINNQSSPAASWISPTETQAFAINGNTLTPPIQIRDMVESFKNDLLTSSGGTATTIPGAAVTIKDKLTTAQKLINQIIGPKIGTIRAFGYGLSSLSAPAQIGQYAEGLMSLSKSFGSKIVGQNGSVNPNLADVWSRITAVGETFNFLAKDDLVGLSNKLGLSQSAMGASDSKDMIIPQVAQYADFLKTQGTFLAGVSGAAKNTLGQQVAKDQQVGGQSITDIFKGASDANVAKDGKIENKTATPPSTLLDLGKKVFNPYASFAGVDDRFNLINYLMDQIKGQVNQHFTGGVNLLRDYLKAQDSIILSPADQRDKLATSNVFGEYARANSVLLALTNGEFGALPDVQKIKELASFRDAQQQAKKDKAAQEAKDPGKVVGMATGGVVYASNGTLVNYQPRGTDTVPAMLTPGEFVVNRSATQKNLPLLHAINSGGTQGLNRGGIVNYLQSGGIILPQYHRDGAVSGSTNSVVGGGSIKVDGSSAARGLESALTVGTNALKQVLQGFGISPASITAINNFVTGLQKVSEVLANINITPEVKFTGSVDVNVKGAEGLTGPMRDLVNSAINNAMTRLQSSNNGSTLQVPQGDFTSGFTSGLA